MKRLFILFSLVLLYLIFTSTAFAQDENPEIPTDDEVNAIARQMYCPVCENTPLDVCPTQACMEWRELIRTKLTEGWNDKQIEEYFVEQFGYRVLATPPARGLNWLVYVVPPTAFLVGAYLLFRVFHTMKKPEAHESHLDPDPQQTPDPINDEYYERLEEKIRNLSETEW